MGGLLELVFPLGVRDLLEEGVFLQSWPVLFRKIGFLALVEGAVFLFSLLGSYYGGKLSARVENDLRMTLFRHLTHLSFAFFDYSRTGKLMATLMGDISEAGDLVSRIPGDFAVSLVTAVGTIILLLYLNRPWALSSLSSWPLRSSIPSSLAESSGTNMDGTEGNLDTCPPWAKKT